MAKKPVDQLGELQRQVLEFLWESEGATVQEVLDEVHRRGKKLAYTTVLTTLQNLERAGWVKHKKSGRAHLYSATRSRTQAGTSSLRQFIKRAFGGDSKLMFESLVNDKQLCDSDLKLLKKLIEEKQREKKK